MFLRNDALDRVCSDDEWSDARTSAWRIAVCQNARGARTIVSGDTVGRVRWTDTAGALEHEQACSAGAAPCVGVVKTRREFRILCGGRGRDVSIFDGSSGEATCTLTHDENVTCLAVGAVDCADLEKETEDGLLVLTGSDDGNARLWSLHHYFVLRTFEGHTLAVSAVCFSDGGRTVLSASLDRSVRTWDANSAQCLFM
ncbi:WD40-repeat-containing domain protein [Pelagophyceae sp. CCMP2097]|nr:WD40-repeat-containing domain protein [Pelagophyceae sp. CCMP2097]